MDPLGLHSAADIYYNLNIFLEEEWKIKGKAEYRLNAAAMELKKVNVPRQPNGYDCGVYIGLYLESLLRSVCEGVKSDSFGLVFHVDMYSNRRLYGDDIPQTERDKILVLMEKAEEDYREAQNIKKNPPQIREPFKGTPVNTLKRKRVASQEKADDDEVVPVKVTSVAENKPKSRPFASKIVDTEMLKYLQRQYAFIDKINLHTGANSANGPINGELTCEGFYKVAEKLVEKYELDANSVFLDLGSGQGKPTFHVFEQVKTKVCMGIEIDDHRHKMSVNNLIRFVQRDMVSGGNTFKDKRIIFLHKDAAEMSSYAPSTHVYQFDFGIPPVAMKRIATVFNRTSTARFLVSYFNETKLKAFGYEVEFMEQLGNLPFTGSGYKKTAYFYRKKNTHVKGNVHKVYEDEDLWGLYQSMTGCDVHKYAATAKEMMRPNDNPSDEGKIVTRSASLRNK